ncbi:hypothetical protein [Turneriella parva]|uniref:Uncharacterized protein n=1 Tax=Turneriella parva (strain ATCC BAA-1111 / DSM 21527 / NCTC 11395 / H) TaxID=869212 RepID=I4B4Q4_TURPD|nr:hypothetical protein [Turneriella parva]AFM12261.1 hypothetical protein Turpa_1613 [Turneriella parva DSM 21527]
MTPSGFRFSRLQVVFQVFFAVLLIFCSRKPPEWSPDLKNFLNKANRELDELAPFFMRNSSPEKVMDGLGRLDKFMDGIVVDMRRMIEKYPELLKDSRAVGTYHRLEIKLLQDNIERIQKDGAYWYQKLNKQKRYIDLVQRIHTKIRIADKMTVPPN